MYVLLGCRLFQGFFVGNYMAIIPIYINEIAPKQVMASYGVFTQLFVVIGIIFSYGMGLIFNAVGLSAFLFYRLMVGIIAIFTIFQSVLLMSGYIP